MRLVVAALVLAAGAPAAAQSLPPYLFDALKRPAYQQAWAGITRGQKGLPPWTSAAGLNRAPSTPGVAVMVEGRRRERFHACQQHDCAGNELVVLFSGGGRGPAQALVADANGRRFFGRPDAAEAQALAGGLD